MTPISFEEATRTLAAPLGWDKERHGQCGGLPVWHEGDRFISCWRPSWRERLAVLFGAPVWLSVVGIGQPPVALHAVRNMFKKAAVIISRAA